MTLYHILLIAEGLGKYYYINSILIFLWNIYMFLVLGFWDFLLVFCFCFLEVIYIYIYISCHAVSTDFPEPLPPPISIVHRSREVFKAISCNGTELLYIGSCWSSWFWPSIWRGPQKYIAYEFVTTSPAVSYMYDSSNLDSFRDGW